MKVRIRKRSKELTGYYAGRAFAVKYAVSPITKNLFLCGKYREVASSDAQAMHDAQFNTSPRTGVQQ